MGRAPAAERVITHWISPTTKSSSDRISTSISCSILKRHAAVWSAFKILLVSISFKNAGRGNRSGLYKIDRGDFAVPSAVDTSWIFNRETPISVHDGF